MGETGLLKRASLAPALVPWLRLFGSANNGGAGIVRLIT